MAGSPAAGGKTDSTAGPNFEFLELHVAAGAAVITAGSAETVTSLAADKRILELAAENSEDASASTVVDDPG
jgi:hypothetical protein